MSHEKTLREAFHQYMRPSDPGYQKTMEAINILVETIGALSGETDTLRARIAELEAEVARLRNVMRQVARTTSDPDATDALDAALEAKP